MAFFVSVVIFFIALPVNAWWEESAIKFQGISFDTEFLGTNYDDYNSSKIFFSSNGRDEVINYEGGGQFLAGFSTKINFDKNEKYWIHVAYRSTLLTTDKNQSKGNLNDIDFLKKESSFLLETYYRLGRIAGDLKYYSLSNGKIKLSDTSGDRNGNEGIEIGNYQLYVKRYQLSAHYKFKNFPFYIGARYMNAQIPRLPYTYDSLSFRGAGDLQIIKYQSLLASLELGESEFIPMSRLAGFKWSMGFAMGIGEFDFRNDTNKQLRESSSMFHIKFAWGYQFNFGAINGKKRTDKESQYFLRLNNSVHLMSFDNNDSSTDARNSTVYRTGGADEEYRILVRLGYNFN